METAMRMLTIAMALIASLLSDPSANSQKKLVGGGCEGCELIHVGMPEQLTSETSLVNKKESGARLEISGTIYQRDGKTPAAGVILYVYQTSAKGYYEDSPQLPGAAKRHGRLRGWMKTDAQGRYRFSSVKPAPYPGERIPAHIHPVILEPGKNEYYIDDYLFDDDPLLTTAERAKQEKHGGPGIIALTKDAHGVLTGKRDIILGMNIPDYP